ncbi:hypothetical protein L3N51_01434 [Metallosphaera sp. J1]|uniref:hypothetical protein n=1 Tax=Metallosphaera TaxID=41980 RepID=UPI001EDC990C|nr:hypothetical protein [Metallosphaera javensis (ex Hofmann et al. 2022)]MCG3109144.1 hypothetical protein [Metallosphaera javensis (ex Hofmann et al. 2022)]BCS93700.1 MAG: hypothetical protein MjAS7_2308 [Metallosphaera javensis (ex Sakai et al. 2022)]
MFLTLLEIINLALSTTSLVLLWKLVDYYNGMIKSMKNKVINASILDFLISLTDLFSQGEATNLLEDLFVYITNLQGKEWNDIYTEVVNRFIPIKRQLEMVLNKANEIGNLTNRINSTTFITRSIRILSVITVIETVLGPFSGLMSSFQFKVVLYGNVVLLILIIIVLVIYVYDTTKHMSSVMKAVKRMDKSP